MQDENYRWVIMAVFGSLAVVNGMCWTVLAPISLQVTRQYQVSQLAVDAVSLVYMAVYILFNFPANWILDQFDFRGGLVLGAVLTALGAVMRININDGFWTVLAGQTLLAFGQPLILNSPTKIAWQWFSQDQRPVANALLSTFNIVGTGVGFVIPSLVVDELADDNATNFRNLMVIEAIPCLAVLFLVVVLFQEGPYAEH